MMSSQISRARSLVFAAALLSISGVVLAQSRSAVRVHTDATGTYLVTDAPGLQGRSGPGTDDILWTFSDPIAIPQSLSLSEGTNLAWVGQTLNSERLQTFRMPGNGVPLREWTAGADSPALVSAANDADLAVFLDKNGGPYSLGACTSSDPSELWHVDFDANFNGAAGLKISRDGTVAAALLVDGNAGHSTLYAYNAATGELIQRVEFNGYGGWVDLTADGSLAFVTLGQDGIVIDIATGEEKFHKSANGAGGRFNISANGDVLVMGSFDLRVFKRSGDTWNSAFTYGAATSWFGWGSAVSADGSTVGVISHDYSTNLKTTTRIFDVASGTLLGHYDTQGQGAYQDAAAGAVLSDDGSRLTVGSWGTQNNAHPECMVFDRQCNLIDSVDTAGSIFGLDMTPGGRFVVPGNKSVHANVFGNGGTVTLLDLGAPDGCYPDFDGNGALDLFDFLAYINGFNAQQDRADCDANGLFDFFDFLCYQNAFVAGC